jgi:hypothetical protein
MDIEYNCEKVYYGNRPLLKEEIKGKYAGDTGPSLFTDKTTQDDSGGRF